MARIVSVNLSSRKGVAKDPVAEIRLLPDFGVEGDAHAGPGNRQVSLMAIESYRRFEAMKGNCLKHGSFGENILTEGIELHILAVGTKLTVGSALAEVTQIGKKCHAPCEIARTHGSCIMPKEGIFVRVLKGGRIIPGDKLVVTAQ
jgi:cyclic pyranopterin monophosphate synthase